MIGSMNEHCFVLCVLVFLGENRIFIFNFNIKRGYKTWCKILYLCFVFSGHCGVEQVKRSKRNKPEEIQLEAPPSDISVGAHSSSTLHKHTFNTKALSCINYIGRSTTPGHQHLYYAASESCLRDFSVSVHVCRTNCPYSRTLLFISKDESVFTCICQKKENALFSFSGQFIVLSWMCGERWMVRVPFETSKVVL